MKPAPCFDRLQKKEMEIRRLLDAWPNELAVEAAHRVKTERDELMEELHNRLQEYRCGCGHPACKSCRNDHMTEQVLKKINKVANND